MFDPFFNSIFGSMISWNPAISLVIISSALTLISTIVYKYATDQNMLKELKAEMKQLQEDIKKFKDNPAKVMEAQKIIMEKNMRMMTHTMKPALFTIIPFFIIFGWLNATFIYEPPSVNIEFPIEIVLANEEIGKNISISSETLTILDDTTKAIEKRKTWYSWFMKEGSAKWSLKGDKGMHTTNISYNGVNYQKQINISETGWNPIKSERLSSDTHIKEIDVGKKFKPFLGMGYILSYILISLIVSMSLRKLLKIY